MVGSHVRAPYLSTLNVRQQLLLTMTAPKSVTILNVPTHFTAVVLCTAIVGVEINGRFALGD